MTMKKSKNRIKYEQNQRVMPLFDNSIKGPLLTVNETAQLLNVSERTVRDWVFKRQIPYMKIRGVVRLDKTEIERWIARSSQNGDSNLKI